MTASLDALKAGRDAALYYINDPNRERSALRRDEYYAQDGGGVWWSTGETIVRHNAPIDRKTFQDLCAGYHPAHGGSAVRAAGDTHRAGWDCTFTCGKTISILWAFGTDAQRAWIERIQREAVDEALSLLTKEVLVEARLGAGGHIRQAPTDLIVGKFEHFTSREGDPNVHTHCVIINVAGCADGKWRTLEPARLYEAQHLIGVAMRSALAERLVAAGFRLRPAGRGQYEVAGFPDEMIEAFSKRSAQIEAVTDRSKSGAQKELTALLTRQAKADVPAREELEKRWREEMDGFGVDPWTIASERTSAPHQAIDVEHDLDHFDPPDVVGSGPVAVAASELFRTQSAITRTALLQAAFVDASLKGLGIAAVYSELREMENDGRLVRLADDEIGHQPDRARGAFWTTPDIAASEARMLRSADRCDEREWIKPAALAAALAEAPFLSQEQRGAITFGANQDGVVILEAGAGTGKTTLARTLTAAAKESGLKVLALAPSWVAADEVAISIGVPASAVAKWRYDQRVHQGADLDQDTVILVDEAGMVGTRDMSEILAAAAEKKCKVVLLGDRRQLQAVQGANALGAISDLLQRQASLSEVRRQTVPWQGAASIVMARGNCEAGVRAYARNDRIELVDGEDEAQARAIEAWTSFRKQYGDDTLIITRRNADATSLNQAARATLRAEGHLKSDDVIVPSTDRTGKIRGISLAIGDIVRFGETINAFGIRNGTRAVVSGLNPTDGGNLDVAFRLNDGRIVSDQWAAFTRPRVGKRQMVPRISHAYAGTAYAAQGRTVKAAVMYVAQATDARELYVGLTRHTHDARLIVEQSRLDAAVRVKQVDPRLSSTKTAMLERFFSEAMRYAEKRNVVDFVEDRAMFIADGMVPKATPAPMLNLIRSARSVRLIAMAQAELSRVVSLYQAVRLQTAILRTSARVIVHPIEQRVRILLNRPRDAPVMMHSRGSPDYER